MLGGGKRMKRFWIALLIVICIVGVYAVTTYDVIYHNDVFRGESESWKGEYRINGWWLFTEKGNRIEFDGRVDGVLTLTYLKEVENPPELDHFEIHYDLGSGGGSLIEDDVVMKQVYRFERLSTGVPNKDVVLTAVINMDGDIQTVELIGVK
jgi:hypothetical protein